MFAIIAKRLVFLLFLYACSRAAAADVVKPALIEISANTRGTVSIEVRASLEALLTGINAKYRNTQEAPNAEEYDHYRVMQADELAVAFEPFKPRLLSGVWLEADGKRVPLVIESLIIPEPGYTKVPRISTVYLSGELDRETKSLQWYYPAAFGDNAVRVRQVDEANERWHWSEWQWLRKDQPSEPFSLEELFTRKPLHVTVASYIVLGFEHILPRGMDHILFILGLFLLSQKVRPLLWQVTMFTVAHTITLGLAMNGIVNLPSTVVEPLIALSIAYVGVENIYARSLHKSRLVLVFFFGLLHGMGFAGVLSDFGMPDDAFATALISFNVGVELGQLAVILLAYAVVGFWFRRLAWYRSVVVIPASLAISVVGLYWTFDRFQLDAALALI